jgi:asparaginyl-tRNA synthetase
MMQTYIKEILSIQSEILKFSIEFFHKQKFTQLLPIMLSTITDPLGPDPNSSVIKTGEIEYCDQKLH